MIQGPGLSTTQQFGKYELVDRIAAGGMAEIFKARYAPAPGVTKQVVIKKILPHYAENAAFIGMFTNEARIAMGLSHGNIAQVFDFGAIDGDYFLAMEFVDGQPLSKVVKRARLMGVTILPPQVSAFIIIETLKGLHYAHTRLDEEGRPLHIVHRDVSPQNVLVSYEAQVKVVDFGIARARSEGREETSASAMKGKYVYFSPEQARARDIDLRTDVFAAGVVLYELLTGQLPFQGRMMDVMGKLLRGDFPRPRELNPSLTPELERIVLKAMALDRNERFATAEAFQQELSRDLAQTHPDFHSSDVAHLMQLLFEEELVKAGRPVQLPREFVERAQAWKKGPPRPRDADDEDPTDMMPMGDDGAEPMVSMEHVLSVEHVVSMEHIVSVPQTVPTVPTVAAAAPPAALGPTRRLPLARGALVLLASVVVGVGIVGLVLSHRPATLEVTSMPAGARVTVDGRAVEGLTPVVVPNLTGAHDAHVEVFLPGHLKWSQDVPLKNGARLTVNAALVREPIAASADDRAGLVDLPPPGAADEVRWPVEHVTLELSRHHVDLEAAGATKLKLDPALTYRVALSYGPTPGWGFYVVNDAGATPVVFAGQPLEIKGASSLFAFHLPHDLMGVHLPEEKHPRVLSVQAVGQRRGVQHAVFSRLLVAPNHVVRLVGLSPGKSYEITPRQSSPPGRIREGAPPLTRLLMATSQGLLVISVDEAALMAGVDAAIFTVVSDSSSPSGRVDLEVHEVSRRPR